MGIETLALVGIGLAAGGQVYSGISAQQEGAAENKMAKYNAALEKQKAKQIEKVTAIKQQRQAEAASRLASSQEAGIGASGVVSTQGSPLLIEAKQASQSELENLDIGYEGQIESQQALSQAEMDLMQGRMAKARGKSAMFGSMLSAAGTTMAGFSKYGGSSGGGIESSSTAIKGMPAGYAGMGW